MAYEKTATRSVTELVLKTLTTHIFALASYCYWYRLTKRPIHTELVLRVVFFAFVPALSLVELCINVARTLTTIVANLQDDTEYKFDLAFYLSGAFGMHAQLPESKETKDQLQSLALLDSDGKLLERKRRDLSWAWFGKLLITLIALTQAIGTIIMWIRRMTKSDMACLNFDHRNGAMGIASTICGVMSITILILRLDWTTSASFQAPLANSVTSAYRRFAVQVVLALLVHTMIGMIHNRHNRKLFTSVGFAFFLVRISAVWQTGVLLIFVGLLSRELAAKIRVWSAKVQSIIGVHRWVAIRILVVTCLAIWFLVDIIRLLVMDIIQVAQKSPHSVYHGDYYWRQDRISDRVLVL